MCVCTYIEVEVFLITSGVYIRLDEGEIVALEEVPVSLVICRGSFQWW